MEAGQIGITGPEFRILSEEQIKAVHEASLEILQRTGVTVDSPQGIEVLASAGARVDGKRVRISPNLIQRAIDSAPKRFTFYTREGDPYIRLGERRTYFGGVPDVPEFLDPETGQRCRVSRANVAAMCRLVDALPNLTWLYTAGFAGYVEGLPGDLADRVSFLTALRNSTKPFGCSIASAANLKDMLEACAVVAGGRESLRQKPFFYGTVEPVSPLIEGRDAVEKSLLCAEWGIPNVVYSMPMSGATAPATFAGTLAVANAEVLAHIAMIQVWAPGSPVIFGAMPNVMDMRTSIYPYGAPELPLLVGALTEICHFHGLPMWGTAGCSDAKRLGVQSASEVTAQVMMAALTRADFVHDVGLMDHSNMLSPQLMTMVDEIISMVRAALGGVEVNDATLALDLVDKVGPGGDYLNQEHTLQHFRRFWVPQLFDRTFTIPADGKVLHAEDRLTEKTMRLIREHTPVPLDEGLDRELSRMEESWFKGKGLEYKYPD